MPASPFPGMPGTGRKGSSGTAVSTGICPFAPTMPSGRPQVYTIKLIKKQNRGTTAFRARYRLFHPFTYVEQRNQRSLFLADVNEYLPEGPAMWLWVCLKPGVVAMEAEAGGSYQIRAQNQPGLHSELKISLNYVARSFLKSQI